MSKPKPGTIVVYRGRTTRGIVTTHAYHRLKDQPDRVGVKFPGHWAIYNVADLEVVSKPWRES